MASNGLDIILGYLGKSYPPKDKKDAFFRECRRNLGLETACIAACEIGEFGSELVAYSKGLEDINTPGLFGGITLGLIYSLGHVYRHGKEHSGKTSLREALSYALSTEAGCVVSATAVEYFLGLATSRDPLSTTNLMIRGAGLIPAFALGLAVMSASTYFHNNEATRFLAKHKALPEVRDRLLDSRVKEVVLNSDRKLRINGSESSLVVSERKVPKSISSGDGDLQKSLYVVRSPVCRYDSEARVIIAENMEQSFRDSGIDISRVHNVFRH
ncbi:MAG: hypothetical protein ACP5NS_00150 [Candidatus Pacearchaeota archaeon]